MFKRFTPLVLTSLLLIGCGNTADDEVKVEGSEDLEEVTEVGYFVEDLQTTFTVIPTKIPEITPEQERIVREIEEHVNEVTSSPNYDENGEEIYYSDRELVDMVAGDYPDYTSEELYDKRNDYYAHIHYNDFGEYYVGTEAHNYLHDEALIDNLSAAEVAMDQATSEYNSDYSIFHSTGSYSLDGERARITYVLEFNENYTEAKLLRLAVNGEEAIEFDPESMPVTFTD